MKWPIHITQHAPLQELSEDTAEGVSGPADPDVLSQPQVLHLVLDPALLPVARSLGLVGFDAADVVRGALHQSLHQVIGLFLSSDGGSKVYGIYKFFEKS